MESALQLSQQAFQEEESSVEPTTASPSLLSSSAVAVAAADLASRLLSSLTQLSHDTVFRENLNQSSNILGLGQVFGRCKARPVTEGNPLTRQNLSMSL